MACVKLLFDLADQVGIMNDILIERFTNGTSEYQYGCVKSDITFDAYGKELGQRWNDTANAFVNKSTDCHTIATTLVNAGKILTSVPNQLNQLNQSNGNDEKVVIDAIVDYVAGDNSFKFVFSNDMSSTVKNLLNMYVNYCSCQFADIFRYIVGKYKNKYKQKLIGMKMDEMKALMHQEYGRFKHSIIAIHSTPQTDKTAFINNLMSRLTSVGNFSIEGELDKLIPSELGSMKEFFIIIIKTYFEKLHPIVWGQIYKQMVDNIFIDCPLSSDELFQFASKQLLLNSGPFILKILQMIRPVLTQELATKYNLTKLRYPILQPNQEGIILKNVLDVNMIAIRRRNSASVGHVCIANHVANPNDIFVIKIIKPMSVAQSCWEYKTLYNVFPDGCERDFVRNMLRSNGKEMNVTHEMENIKKGHEYYSCDYNKVFGLSKCEVKLSTVIVRDDILPKNTWHTFVMSLAPGIPVSDLIERELIKGESIYKSKLHRCLDLLVYKFFFNILSNGFYHGDLHSGNIFYSFNQKQMTMIDFGAVGEVNLFDNSDDTKEMLDVIIMSTFYNYDGILDKLTILLNNKCSGQKNNKLVDMNSQEYFNFKKQLLDLHRTNAMNADKEANSTKNYENFIFSDRKLDEENQQPAVPPRNEIKIDYENSIYSYLEYQPREEKLVIETRDTLSTYEILGEEETKSFAQILEMIIKFYAGSGVNIAVKFASFYELQKAYALFLGVLSKVGYNSYRMSIVLKKAIVNIRHLPKILHIQTVKHVVATYYNEHKLFNEVFGVK